MSVFGSLNLNTSTLIDYYNTVNDKKNDTIATVIANRRSNKDRVSATAIGATFGLAQTVAFGGIYAGAKAFPKAQKLFPIKWVYNTVNKWIQIAQKNNPNASKLHNAFVGLAAKGIWAMGACALTGFAFDVYNNLKDKKMNGKFSNVKQGYQEDSWLLSGLKSLSMTKKGKSLIREVMQPTEDGVKIKLKGVNREYRVSNKEIKAASREYATSFDENGKVAKYTKNYSSGDGDVLAFEIALKKYQNDLKTGKIAANSDLPKCANQFSSKGNLSETEVSQIYYFLTGKEPTEITNNTDNPFANSRLESFLESFSTKDNNSVAAFKFKDDGNGAVKIKSLNNLRSTFAADKTYAIKKIEKGTVSFVDPRNTAVTIKMPLAEFKEKFDKIYSAEI